MSSLAKSLMIVIIIRLMHKVVVIDTLRLFNWWLFPHVYFHYLMMVVLQKQEFDHLMGSNLQMDLLVDCEGSFCKSCKLLKSLKFTKKFRQGFPPIWLSHNYKMLENLQIKYPVNLPTRTWKDELLEPPKLNGNIIINCWYAKVNTERKGHKHQA